jgi:hypothetical protein
VLGLAMSHPEGMFRLTLGGTRTAMARSVLIRTCLLVTLVLVGMVEPALPAAAQMLDQTPAVNVYTLTPKRIAASVAGVLGLMGAVVGGVAVARTTRRGTGNARRGAVIALLLGATGLLVGGLVVATADGGLGTGNGLGGGVVALFVGLTGMVLGGLALSRSRRSA